MSANGWSASPSAVTKREATHRLTGKRVPAVGQAAPPMRYNARACLSAQEIKITVSALVECIPNFSEGRRPEVIQAIADAIRAAAPVRLLDTSSDSDHNRTVITFAGTPEAVEAAAFAAIRTAAAHIDMAVQRGAHPRIGATDVVPFVPIRGVTMDDCVAMARRLGMRVGSELNIPVYLYEAAATRPDREDLANIRRGEYEVLKDAIVTDPTRAPDFGPSRLGKAGATVIGARPALIAFNVYLTTDNVEIAKKIAKVIRHSSGGLHFVKALGLLVEGRAQVSMNLTNFEKTPIYRAVEMIRREATRYGVGIAYSELIGLAPEEAFVDTARWYLQLDLFQSDQLLERRLESIPAPATESRSGGGKDDIDTFLNDLAAATPAPGGGAVAALVGALSAALAEMVGGLTLGRKKYADVEVEIASVIPAATNAREHLRGAIDGDIAAYTKVMDAYRLPKDEVGRDARIQAALLVAAQSPLAVMTATVETMRIALLPTAKLGNVNAVTDAGVAAHMALAAVESAALNVQINVKGMTDPVAARTLLDQTTTLLDQARALQKDIVALVHERAGLN